MIEAVTFSIDVPDLQAGVEFYTEGLGFEARDRVSSDAFRLAAVDVRIDLVEREAGSSPFLGESLGRTYDRHWTPVHLDLVVADVDAAIQTARDAGATLESGPRPIGEEVIAGCTDPFGNGFCLIEYVGA